MTNFQTLLFIIIAVPLLLIQGLWMFFDARKKGESYYWLWGILGLLNFPTPIIIYLIVTRIKQSKCKNCSQVVGKEYKTCPNCGENLKKTCPECGCNINEKWTYCPNCSKNLKEK